MPFNDSVGGKDATPLSSGVEEGVGTDEGAGVDDTVAADFSMIANHCAELAESGRLKSAFGEGDEDFFAIEANVRQDDAGAEVGGVAENGIADVVEVGDLCAVENQTVFEFARVSEDAVIPNDYVFTDVATASNFAV